MTWLNRGGLLFVVLVLVTSACWIAFKTTWLVATGPDRPVTAELGNPVSVATPEQQDAALANWGGLFGDISNDASNAKASEREDLDVNLLGVIDNVEEGGETVIVKLSDHHQKVFRLGDALINDLKLVSIGKEQAVLSNGVDEFLLSLKEERPHMDGSSPNGVTPEDEPGRAAQQSSTHKKMQAFAGLKPVQEGAAAGYRLGKGSKKTQESLGLQRGDIILSMNGYPLGTEADDKMAAYARGDDPISLRVRRGEEIIVVTVEK